MRPKEVTLGLVFLICWVPLAFADKPRICYIVNEKSGLVLSVDHHSLNDHARIIQLPFQKFRNQLWVVTKNTAGYKIVNHTSGRLLDVPHGVRKVGLPIVQFGLYQGKNQTWAFSRGKGQFKNSFAIRSVATDLVLGVDHSSVAPGAPICQWKPTEGPTQKWRIVEVSEAEVKNMIDAPPPQAPPEPIGGGEVLSTLIGAAIGAYSESRQRSLAEIDANRARIASEGFFVGAKVQSNTGPLWNKNNIRKGTVVHRVSESVLRIRIDEAGYQSNYQGREGTSVEVLVDELEAFSP